MRRLPHADHVTDLDQFRGFGRVLIHFDFSAEHSLGGL
jgi:hypothetical protein